MVPDMQENKYNRKGRGKGGGMGDKIDSQSKITTA